jgi:hypothetical protein
MNCRLRLLTLVSILSALSYPAYPQAQTSKEKAGKGKSVVTQSNVPVQGSGTTGRLTKWTGLNSGSALIGDSTVFESKTGLVGIGTDNPTSKLTVQGMIETTLGGFKFPDGTLQTTAAVSGSIAVVTNNTLSGNGTTGSPLRVAVPLVLTGDGSANVLRVESTGGNFAAIEIVSAVTGLISKGGQGFNSDPGAAGILGQGGSAQNGSAGFGGTMFGGSSSGANGGGGLLASAGSGTGAGHRGGTGLVAIAGEGMNGATDGLAGLFEGDVQITGNLSKGGGSFKIDHPLDPEKKYLYHSFVESPDMMNIYNGNVTTDENGEAAVTLPDWFQALNRDFRYQLTTIGPFAQATIYEKIKNNRFVIKTSVPGTEVSWQVTGIRKDPYANKHRIPVEEMKTESERGLYLHPDAYDLSDEKGVMRVQHEPRTPKREQR